MVMLNFLQKIMRFINLGIKSMLVTFTWQMMDKNDAVIKEWKQSYNLIKKEDTWKIIMSTFHIKN